MKKINWTKAIVFGVLIWLITDYFVWCFMNFDLIDKIIPKIFVILVAGLLSFFFALNFRYLTLLQAFEYGLIWIAICVILDIIIIIQFNLDIFNTWEYMLGHALIIVIPIIVAKLKETETTDAPQGEATQN
jgi:hypothetical protein